MSNLLSKLIVDFFTSEKSVDYIIRPPVKTLSQKVEYLLNEIESAYNKAILGKMERDIFHADIVEIGKQLFNYRSTNPAGDFLKKTDRGTYVTEMISSELSLRDIKTVVTDFENRIRYFGNEISWIDILALSFIKSHYPELINFFESTIDYFEEKSIMNREFPVGISRSDRQEGSQEVFDKFISTFLPNINVKNKNKYLGLIGLVAHFYFDKIVLKQSSNAEERSLKEQSTCNYSYFKKYFMEQKEFKDFDSGSYGLYKLLVKDFNQISKRQNIEIYNLSQFIRNRISLDTSPSFYFKLASEILNRFESGSLPFVGYDNSGDSLRIKLTYEFCYLLLWYLENVDNDEKLISRAKLLFIRFVKSSHISYTSKFIVISAFADHEKAGRGDVDFRFERVWRDILNGDSNKDFISAIKNVFNEYNNVFLIDKKISVYNNEEHYTYVMYQYWSGDKNDEDVKKIRDLAIRDLDKYPDVINKYWTNYPSVEELKSKDILSSFKYSQVGTLNLYMPLNNLIEISSKVKKINRITRSKLIGWQKNINDIQSQDKYKYLFDFKSVNDTLRGSLMRKNIL